MAYGTYSINVNIGGVQITKQITREGNHPNPYEVVLHVATAGTLTAVDVGNNVGNVTLGAGHGLTSGTYDVYFATGIRYGVEGTIADNTLSLINGSGDTIAANNTACQVSKVTQINTAIDGDASELFTLSLESANATSDANGHIQFQATAAEEIAEVDLDANSPRVWDFDGGDTNILTGNVVVTAYASHNSTTEALTLKVVSLENA
jgi:hypothetical protein